MIKRRTSFNPKRKIKDFSSAEAAEQSQFSVLALKVQYRGNPEHKRNPGDFGLTPPSQPREGKTLCDGSGIIHKADAQSLLQEGVRRGLVSIQERNGWPQNVWAVTEKGTPLEAQHEGNGFYHGYPIPDRDPFRVEVLSRWNAE